MTWLAQVGHVTAYEMRRARWYLVAWGVLLLTATALTAGPFMVPYSTLDVLAAAVTVFGALILTAAIQEDAPVRVGSYWTTLPLMPSAVAAARLLLGLLFILLPAICGFAALATLGAPRLAGAQMIARGAWAFGLILLALAVVAAITDDLQSFVLTAVFAAIVWLLAGTAIAALLPQTILRPTGPAWVPPPAPRVPHLLFLVTLIGGGGACVILGLVYRRRDVGRLIRLPALLIAPMAAWAAIGAVGSAYVNVRSDVGGRPVIRLSPAPHTPVDSHGMYFAVAVDSVPPDVRVQLLLDSAIAHLRDGRTVRMQRPRWGGTIQQAALDTTSRIEWSFAKPFSPPVLHLQADPQGGHEPLVDVQSVEVFGTVWEQRLRPIATLPLGEGAQVVGNGGRVRTITFERDADSITVELRALMTGDLDPSTFAGFPQNPTNVVLAVVNDRRHEALMLPTTYTSVEHVWLVEPGTSGRVYDLRFRVRRHNRDATLGMPADDWYAGARLQLSGLTWPSIEPVDLTYTARR